MLKDGLVWLFGLAKADQKLGGSVLTILLNLQLAIPSRGSAVVCFLLIRTREQTSIPGFQTGEGVSRFPSTREDQSAFSGPLRLGKSSLRFQVPFDLGGSFFVLRSPSTWEDLSSFSGSLRLGRIRFDLRFPLTWEDLTSISGSV